MTNAPDHPRQRPKLRDNASALQLANVASYALPTWVHEADEGSGCSGRTVPEADLALLTMKEAAAYLRVSTRTVQRQIKDGYLQAVRIGRSVRIERSALAQALLPKSSFTSNALDHCRD
jgi:excisionase family DNA binding protein